MQTVNAMFYHGIWSKEVMTVNSFRDDASSRAFPGRSEMMTWYPASFAA